MAAEQVVQRGLCAAGAQEVGDPVELQDGSGLLEAGAPYICVKITQSAFCIQKAMESIHVLPGIFNAESHKVKPLYAGYQEGPRSRSERGGNQKSELLQPHSCPTCGASSNCRSPEQPSEA